MSLPKRVTFTSKVQVKSFVNYMNKQYSNIKLTFEVKQNNTFAILDIIICHEYNKFTDLVNRKPSFSGVLTNFTSFILLLCKFALRENVQILSFFWSVFSRIYSKYGKIPTRINSVFDHFLHRSS